MARLAAECVHLTDGPDILIRPIDRSDAAGLARGLEKLSPESQYRRFLTSKSSFSRAELKYFTDVDHHNHEAIVALSAGDENGIGIARFVRDPDDPGTAEAAVAVADEWQSKGVGHALMDRLAKRASEEGVLTLSATVLESNAGAIQLLSGLGSLKFKRAGFGVVNLRITLPTDGSCPAVAKGCLRAAARGDLELLPSEPRLH